MSMRKLEYEVRFLTPAFLGNAEQNGQWRTPPFKALLRQWWRVARVNELLRTGYDHATIHVRLREEEGRLFGNAWLKDSEGRPDYCRSRVTVRLEHWNPGQMNSQAWPGGPMDFVVTTADGKGSVRADVYLGFGPVLPQSKKENRPTITIRPAIGTDNKGILRLFTSEADKLRKTMQLIAWFGTIGSRSRNGWGSLSFEALNGSPRLATIPLTNDALIMAIGREWSECLDLDWPHALGTTRGRPLIWFSKPCENWRIAMGCLANVRVEIRRAAKSFVGPNQIGGIHLLGYPAGGKWELPEFKKGKPSKEDDEGRLATQLRFKVCAVPEGFLAMVFHVPHRFPDALRNRLRQEQQDWLVQNERKVWETVHKTLDGMSRVEHIGKQND